MFLWSRREAQLAGLGGMRQCGAFMVLTESGMLARVAQAGHLSRRELVWESQENGRGSCPLQFSCRR